MSDEENKEDPIEEPVEESSMNLNEYNDLNEDEEDEDDMNNNYDEDEYNYEYNTMNNNNNEPDDDDIIDNYSEIDRIFEEVLMTYITSTRTFSIPPISEPNTPSPYYYTSRTNSIIIPQTSSFDIGYRYPSTSERRFNNMRRFNDTFLDRIIDRIIDPFESVLNQSFDEQPTVAKINEEMEIESFKYNSLKTDDKEKNCCICLEDFAEEDEVSFSKCHHLFHTKCVKEWSTYKTTCPVCRENFE